MKRTDLLLAGLTCTAMLLLLAGCARPVSPYTTQARKVAERRKAQQSAKPDPQVDMPGGAVSEMTINGEVIRAEDILDPIRPDLRKRAEGMPPDAYREHVARQAAVLIMRKITDTLLYQEAEKRMLESERKYLETLVDGEVRKIVTTQFGGSQRRYEKYLEERGQILGDVYEETRRQLTIMRHVELNIKPKVPEPTRGELLSMYETTADEWRRPPRRSMSLIDVRVRDRLPQGLDYPSEEELKTAQAAARRRIEAAESEIRSGKPFSEVAGAYSDGLHAEDGGEWGWVTTEGVREAFAPAVEALQQLEPNQVSGIIETKDRFFLVKCDEFDPGADPTFEGLQPELKQRYFRTEYARLEGELVKELQEGATITPENLDDFFAAVLATAPPASEHESP
ncbi:MAG: peptidylprolyl isomerase [Phycisphaerales bacterium]|nr:MAG: peptidylprolyl isomerase [Phycisphaerales bacterium]